jgi:hypothetical protein
LAMPDLRTEAEESAWWDQYDTDGQDFLEADKNGTLGSGTLVRKFGITPTTTISLDPADVLRARKQAEKRGLRYQTYLKMLIQEGLQTSELQ